jgi:hypothetical protein
MRSYHHIIRQLKLVPILFFGIGCFLLASPAAMAQKKPEKPPKPIKITVTTLNNIEFGRIVPTGSAGYVTVSPSGLRSSSNVILLSSPTPMSAIIDVESLPGTLIQIGFPTFATLNGSATGTLNLRNFTSDHSPSFISTLDHTLVYIGGTLDVNQITVNPAGIYGGTFLVTFTQIHQ